MLKTFLARNENTLDYLIKETIEEKNIFRYLCLPNYSHTYSSLPQQSMVPPVHFTPTSFSWVQKKFLFGERLQWIRLDSCPWHLTEFTTILPLPRPNSATWEYSASPQPNSKHTTLAARISHPRSQTVPHCPWKFTSTIPEQWSPFTTRIVPKPEAATPSHRAPNRPVMRRKEQ